MSFSSFVKNSGSGQIWVGQCQNSDIKLVIDIRLFGSDNSNETKFESKSSSDNRNVKKVMSEFKIRTKNSYLYPIVF